MMQYSVLMSVYRKEEPAFLRRAIESMLEQTAAPSDFVIVCDGPLTPELDAVLEDFCLQRPGLFQLLRLPENRGLGLALKEGLALCRWELVARMDSDDVSLPDRLEKQLEAFSREPDAAVVGGQISEFAGSEENIVDYRRVPLEWDAIRKRAASRNPMNHVTALLKKSTVLQVGSYADFPGFEDYHLWVRLLQAGMKLVNIDHVCCNVRVDPRMYGRRGGWDYFKKTMKMENFLRSSGFITAADFCRNVTVRFLGTVVCPNWLRGLLFRRLMRKKD